ncbi:hypothetical protein [Corynebacterium sp. sy039]|uniref:hypothetical protein n=1 Tax=Corynebacterium sp. sy039 TaxID=2599641 RepID=UPI0011B830DF|nr:hypothetical protein [Corynebacterium sp. sy039]QDZ42862.1 hypothetical protein FQV43_06565 [Corynebacterium sp. sy039]
MDSVSTLSGIKIPAIIYSALLGMTITLGSMVTTLKLDIPLWAWAPVFALLWSVTHASLKHNSAVSDNGTITIDHKRVLTLALCGLVLFLAVVCVALMGS